MKSSGLLRLISLFLLLAFQPWTLAGPQGNGQGGGGTSGGGTGGTVPRNVPSNQPPVVPSTPDSRNQQQPMPSLVFFSGTVIQEDGSPPPFGTVIELDCGSSVTREATVSLNGHFAFQAGDTNRFSQVLPDASEGFVAPFGREPANGSPYQSMVFPSSTPQQAATRLMGCEVRAQLQGYRSTVLRLDGAPMTGQNQLGTIIIYPVTRVRGGTVSATSLLAPKAAKKSVERARKAFQKKKLKETETLLKSAVEIYPKYGEAWFELGQLYLSQRRIDEARTAYEKAIEADKLYVSPYVRLCWIASMEQKWKEAADLSDQALDLDPISFPDVYYLNALAYYSLKDMAVAEKRARQEERLDTRHRFPQVYLILSNILAMKNDSSGSMEEMRNYLKYAPNAPDAGIVRSRLQEKEKLAKSASK